MNKEKFDIIIAGSGLGGLVCGYILAKNGYKVAIFEKHTQIGGCLQVFMRNGVKFDTGMHYIGSMDKGQILYRFFKYLNLLDEVKLSRLDTMGYEVISMGGKIYRFANGYENFVKTLSGHFPDNEGDIRLYVNKIKEIADASPLYNLQQINTNVYIEADYIKTSVNEFIASITKNVHLQSILAGTLPLYAGVKDKTPTYIHALLNNFYLQSTFRIMGGSDAIAKSLARSIEHCGGKIFTNSEIDEFICDEKQMTKIRLTNGQEFEAQYFISNIHPQVTLEKIKSKLIRNAYRKRIANIDNTISNFTLFVKFKKNTVKYLNYNFYYYDNEDVWSFTDYKTEDWPQSYLYMHQCTNDRQEYAESAEIICYMRYDEVKKWEDTRIGKRGIDYEQFKKEKQEKVLDKLERSFAGIRETIESIHTSTPLTYRDYTATKEGSMYGIIRDKNFPMQTLVSQRTKIPNLFLTGQNINSHGILGVTIGAIITCAEFIDKNEIIRQIEESNK
jgi:all-trans-retinol 13,14-reductase